jgi:hypothetical protein
MGTPVIVIGSGFGTSGSCYQFQDGYPFPLVLSGYSDTIIRFTLSNKGGRMDALTGFTFRVLVVPNGEIVGVMSDTYTAVPAVPAVPTDLKQEGAFVTLRPNPDRYLPDPLLKVPCGWITQVVQKNGTYVISMRPSFDDKLRLGEVVVVAADIERVYSTSETARMLSLGYIWPLSGV